MSAADALREPLVDALPVPAISVVVATHDDGNWDNFVAAVESVRRQSFQACEIVVAVDHNESLAARVRVSMPDVIVVENYGRKGASDTRNSGAAVSRGDFLAFLDDDAVAGEGWLDLLTGELLKEETLGAGGGLAPLWEGRRPLWFADEFAWVVGATYTGLPDEVEKVRNVWTGNMVVRTDVFRRVQGFRSDFGKVGKRSRPEDTEFCLRVAAAEPTRTWIFVPKATVEHRVPASRESFRFFLKRCFAEGRGKVALARISGWSSLALERHHGLIVVPRGIGQALKRAVRGKPVEVLRALAMTLGLAAVAVGALVELGSVFVPIRSAEAQGDQ